VEDLKRFNVAKLLRGGLERARGRAGFGLIEPVVGIVLMSIGLLAMAGLALSVSAFQQEAMVRTAQALAGQELLEQAQRSPFASVVSGSDTVTIGNTTYPATRTVTQLGPWVKEIQVTIADPSGKTSRTYTTRMTTPRPLPPP